jgi:hypothetical protein
MPWFNVGSGSRRAKPERMQRFDQAHFVVVDVFADLHEARHLKCKPSPEISPSAVQRFEREAWERLIEYLVKLPPLLRDY